MKKYCFKPRLAGGITAKTGILCLHSGKLREACRETGRNG